MSETSKPTSTQRTDQQANWSVTFKQYFWDLVKDIFDLDRGVNKKATILEIKSKQSMSGANAWMLFCSIMIASIGLNLDSQAVIIGAMLISPLMSPILGIGMGVAINDKDALNHALMHFGAAIIIALIASTVYFWLTPLNEFTPQIEARTEPTFYDVVIAVFGGIAGIISIARKDISTTLPGVAIATALMPPLCVAGYGLANGSIEIASKAFYLFFLNSFFVAFSTYVILRLMNFPHKVYASKKERRKNIAFVTIFSILMLVPSFLIFKSVFQEHNQEEMLEQFFVDAFQGDTINYLDGHEVYPELEPYGLRLKVYKNVINDSLKPTYLNKLHQVGLDYLTEIQIVSTSEVNAKNLNQVNDRVDKLNARVNEMPDEREIKETIIQELKSKDDFFIQDSTKFNQICEDLKIFFPEIKEFSLAVSQSTNFESRENGIPTAIIQWTKPRKGEVEKLTEYVKRSYNLDTLKVAVVR